LIQFRQDIVIAKKKTKNVFHVNHSKRFERSGHLDQQQLIFQNVRLLWNDFYICKKRPLQKWVQLE